MRTFRIVTYNIHKCRGMDRRVRPERIAEVLRETNADIIALQEVLSVHGTSPEMNQAQFIAGELGMEFAIGENRRLRGGPYGNVVLSRFSLESVRNFDITVRGREPRGCMRADVRVFDSVLHVFNAHLGTSILERSKQAHRLVGEDILNETTARRGNRIVLGDFNDWARGAPTRLLSLHFKSADLAHHLQRKRTYPGLLPLVHLDHVYFDEQLELAKLSLHRTKTSLLASDHLPLVADFEISDRR